MRILISSYQIDIVRGFGAPEMHGPHTLALPNLGTGRRPKQTRFFFAYFEIALCCKDVFGISTNIVLNGVQFPPPEKLKL